MKQMLSKKLSQTSSQASIERAERETRNSVDPAPEELYELVSNALDAGSKTALANIESCNDFGDGWKYQLEELVYGGAFSKEQVGKLEEKLNKLVQHVARVKTHVLATRVICGVSNPPEGDNPATAVLVGSTYGNNHR